MKKIRSGFTLIELLIVIVIIGILSVAFLPTVLSGPKKARDATRKVTVENIAKAVEVYMLDNGKYPAVIGNLTTYFPNNAIPSEPKDSAYTLKVETNCYIVSAKVEMQANANAKTIPIDCATVFTLPDANNQFYVVRNTK